MCGIAGIFNIYGNYPIEVQTLRKMSSLLGHRGPEEMGMYKDQHAGLIHSRLSIIDLEGGRQPISNEDRTKWIVSNGEIFNYPELRDYLVSKGHRFQTRSDTEVILHLFEEKGRGCLDQLNGQFAFVIWDNGRNELFAARDRFGIAPFFYTFASGVMLFASEVKALTADARVRVSLDPEGLDQLFQFWSNIPPKTVFKNIYELPPGHFVTARKRSYSVGKYWDLDFGAVDESRGEDEWGSGLLDLLEDSVRIRLRADVPVGAYLSGGLDSSVIASLIKKNRADDLHTFSVNFSDAWYDEGSHQDEAVRFMDVIHSKFTCSPELIAESMPEVVWHAEKPLIRTAPAPLFLLSAFVRKNGFKVVLTGEGADEMLAGYDIFREAKIRSFWAKIPSSKIRPLLFNRLYSYLPNWQKKASPFIGGFYRGGLLNLSEPYYSHRPRWKTSSWRNLLYSEEFREQLSGYDPCDEIGASMPPDFKRWGQLQRAQYLEIKTLLSGNLLSSQGDRMLMANSVEGRFPFLDHRIAEYCALMPERLKLKTLNEKYILKKAASGIVPRSILSRAKQGYRAPDAECFLNRKNESYINDLLSRKNLARSGIFDPGSVEKLVRVCAASDPQLLGARQNMALTAVATTMILEKLFVRGCGAPESIYACKTG